MTRIAARWSFAVVLLALVAGAQPLAAQDTTSLKRLIVTGETLSGSEPLALVGSWRYQPGDDSGWSEPGADDSGWEVLATPRMNPGNLPSSGWTGIGWFRIRVEAAEEVVGKPLALRLDHPGASEVFLDGRRLGGFGTVGADGESERTFDPNFVPLAFAFDRPGEHVLAIRYSCTASVRPWLPRVLVAGPIASIGSPSTAYSGYETDLSLNLGINAVLSTLMLGFGLLHLLLFTFHRGQRANLYYGLFGVLFGTLIAAGFLRTVLHSGYELSLLLVFAARILVAGTFLALVAFLRSAFAFPLGWTFRVLFGLWIIAVVASLVFPQVWFAFYGINFAIGLSIADAMITISRALQRRLDGAWLIGLGAYCITFALTAQLIAQFFNIQGLWPQAIALAGFFGLPISVSVFLARQTAMTSRALETKLVEVERLSEQTLEHERREAEVRVQREHERAEMALLQAENERKAKELEEARQLQLSMLPSTLPVVPGIEIAAYMKPATEVGGDYYDFHVGPDGTLTIAVGDATGHGLKAGTLVTATKGLFNAFALEPDIVATFHRSSLALKQLNLRYLYMALTLAKVNGNRIRVGAAGMPPMLVWRAATGEVEEIALPGLPLGGAARFPYREREVTLEDGDTVVLMSDGFPERFNEGGEMIDYARARDVLREAAGESPQAIIERFVAEGDAWAGIRPQDDDITFVVLRFGVSGQD